MICPACGLDYYDAGLCRNCGFNKRHVNKQKDMFCFNSRLCNVLNKKNIHPMELDLYMCPDAFDSPGEL